MKENGFRRMLGYRGRLVVDDDLELVKFGLLMLSAARQSGSGSCEQRL
jgi:hypothetical protein